MKKTSGFSSKKVSELKIRSKKRSKKVIQQKKNNEIFENQEIKKNLESFYDKEAKKYAETRKKFWHEEKAILDEITPLFSSCHFDQKEKSMGIIHNRFFANAQNDRDTPDSSANTSEGQVKKLRILEFGCGSGRFATLLNQHFAGKFDYVGIDLSNELLSYASKDNPNLTFFQGDITKLIKNFEQESFDFIIGTSSFQHIPTNKERSYLMKNFYRILDYDGILLMTNRSLSKRFIKKNWKAVIIARIKSWLRLSNNKARDLMVPWTDNNGKVYERFYHFFSLKELEKLAVFSGLTIKTNKYINENGEFTDNEKTSRSSLFVATKTPIEG